MSLRKSPTRTPAFLAACRANARKSHGPKTLAGKSRSRLNHLIHGRNCRVLHRKLPDGLSFGNRLLFNFILRAIENSFQPQAPRHREWVRKLAVQVWCRARRVEENAGISGNVAENRWANPESRLLRIRFRIGTPNPRQKLVFWSQARGRRPRRKVGETRLRAQGFFAAAYGIGGLRDWKWEPTPDPELDAMGMWHWEREMRRQFRAYRRAKAWRARRRQARERFAADLAARYQATSRRLGLPAVAAIANRQSKISQADSG